MILPKLEHTQSVEEAFPPPNFLYHILVDERVTPEEEVFVFGATTMISAAGDLVIQNNQGQRVFGAANGQWFGLFIVDQITFLPVTEFFPNVPTD